MSESRSWSWETALCGVVPPLISPLTPGGEADGPAITRLVKHILGGGCSSLFVLGGCGEGAYLTPGQRAAVLRAAARAASGRVPLLVGVMLPGTGLAVEAARQAADEGADALVVGSPYYYPVDGGMQRRHVEAVLTAVPLPVLLYNIPQATHHSIAPSLATALAEEPRILGIKDSAGDFEAFQAFLRIKQRRPAFCVLQGHETYAAASLLLGSDGLVPGMANFAPTRFVELYRAAVADDVATCTRLQTAIADLDTLHAQGHWLSALKAACALCGLGNGLPAPPLLPASEVDCSAIRAILVRHRLLPSPDQSRILRD